MPENDVREALAALELFEGASPAILERLVMAAHPFSLAAGEYLFREGDPGDRISVIASGSMEAIMRLPGGREVEIEPLRPGGLIGEMAVLAERPRRFSVRATEDCTGWSFAAADIGRFGATEQPEVVRRLGRVALERLREQYTRLAVLMRRRPASGRVCAPRRARRRRPGGGRGAGARGDRLSGDRALLQPLQRCRDRGTFRRPAPAGGAARRLGERELRAGARSF